MLTERRIRDAKPRAKPYMLWDGTVKCLGLKINPGGRKCFVIIYRVNGRQRRATIGVPGEISLADARRRAAALLDGARHDSIDPLEERNARREAPTVAEALDRYFNEHVPQRVDNGRMSHRTVTHYRNWSKHMYASLGKHKVADVRRRHVERMADGLQRTTRNRVLSLTNAVFNVFELWELRPRHSNPAYGIERSAESPRDRVLADQELKNLSQALSAAEDTYPAAVAAIRFASVTGLRIGEVLNIAWQDIDPDSGRLTITESKTGRRVHSMAEPAREILARLPRINRWCFTSGRDAHVTYRHVGHVFRSVAAAAGLSDVRIHDLRRTVITRSAAGGASALIVKDLLGHSTMEAATRYVRQIGAAVAEERERVGLEIAAAMRG